MNDDPDLDLEAALLDAPAPGASTDPLGDAEKIAKLDAEKAKLEERLAEVARERKPVEERLLAYAEEHELQNITVAGRTVYLREEVWAFRDKECDEATFAATLREHPEWAFLVKEAVNAQSMSGRWREALDGRTVEQAVADGDLPEAIAKIVREDVRYSIRSRGAASKPTRRSRG